MASSRSSVPPSPKPLDLDITVVSAKHLKNVNWRHGCLKPYVIFWIDPERRIATKPDDSGSSRPVWNERFTLPVSPPPHSSSSSSFSFYDALLTLEIFHSKPSETPKPLVGTLRFPLKELFPPASDSDPDSDTSPIRTLDIHRPSGRPHGKICLKLALRDRPPPPPPHPTDYHYYPPHSPSPPPPPFLNAPRDYRDGYPHPPPPFRPHPPPPASSPSPPQYPYGGYADPYAAYYYSQPPPPPPPRPFFDRVGPGSYGSAGGPSGPSAPVDYSSPYEHKQKGVGGSKMGLGAGLAVGAVAGALGGLALEEGIKYEEDKIAERIESNISGRDEFNSYPGDY